MNCKMHCTLKRLFVFVTIQVAFGKKQAKETLATEFIKTLEKNILACRNFKEDMEPIQYSTFHLMNRESTIEEILGLYETLFGKTISKKMLTVMTITKTCMNEKNVKTQNMLNFFTAMQKHLSDTKKCSIFVKDLHVTIQYMEGSSVKYYHMLSNTSKNIQAIYMKLNDLLIASIPEIICVIFKQKIMQWFYSLNNEAFYKHLRDTCIVLEDETHKALISRLKHKLGRFPTGFDIIDYMQQVDFILNEIQSTLLDFELQIMFSYFTNEDICLTTAMRYLFKLHQNVIERLMADVVKTGLCLLEDPNNISSFTNLLKALNADNSYLSTNEHYIARYQDIRSKNMENLSTEQKELLNHRYLEQFNSIGFDKLQSDLSQTNQTIFDSMSDDFNEKSTQIIFDKKLSNDNFYILWRILGGMNIFENLNKHQTIVIEMNRRIGEDKIELGARKFEDADFALTNGKRYIKAPGETYQVFSDIIQSISECFDEGKSSKTNFDTHNPNQMRSETSITIEKIKRFSRKKIESNKYKYIARCLVKNDSKFMCMYKMIVTSASTITYIYLIDHVSISEQVLRTSIIFDMQDNAIVTIENASDKVKRKIVFFDNVTRPILNVLSCHLQHLLLKAEPEVKAINMLSDVNFDIILSEKTLYLTKNPDLLMFFVNSLILSLEDETVIDSCHATTTMEGIIKFDPKNSRNDFFLMNLIESLGSNEEAFYRFIRPYLLKYNSVDTRQSDLDPLGSRMNKHQVEMFYISYANGANVLYVCVLDNHNFFTELSRYPSNVMSKIYEQLENEPICKSQSFPRYNNDLDKRIAYMVIDGILKKRYFDLALYKRCKLHSSFYISDSLDNERRGLVLSENQKSAELWDRSNILPEGCIKLTKAESKAIVKRIYSIKKELMTKTKLKLFSFLITNKSEGLHDNNSGECAVNNFCYNNLEHLGLLEEFFANEGYNEQQ